MLEIEQHGDVRRVVMSTRTSRALGYTVSAYLTRGLLIDTGCPGVGRELDAWLSDARPAGALITHHHEDHAGNVELLARRGLPVAAAAATLTLLQQPRSLPFYRRTCWGMPLLLGSAITPLQSDTLALVPAPGHSDDHHVIWDAERETMFGGDLFLGVHVRVAHRFERPRVLLATLRAMTALRPKRLFDAHRGAIRDPVHTLGVKSDWLAELIGSVEELSLRGWSDRAIARRVLGRESGSYYGSLGELGRINVVRGIRERS